MVILIDSFCATHGRHGRMFACDGGGGTMRSRVPEHRWELSVFVSRGLLVEPGSEDVSRYVEDLCI